MLKLLKRLTRQSNFPTTEYPVKYAFTSGGIDYFQLEDFNNTPALRGLKTMVFYEEMKMKCTLEYLKLHTEAMDKVLNASKISIYDVKKLNDQMKQRLDIAIDIEVVYKVASVVFFPKEENITDYDFGYNKRKIEHWKKHSGADFFLSMPITELIPALSNLNENLANYTTVIEALNSKHLENLLQMLPESRTTKLRGKSFFSAVVMPAN